MKTDFSVLTLFVMNVDIYWRFTVKNVTKTAEISTVWRGSNLLKTFVDIIICTAQVHYEV